MSHRTIPTGRVPDELTRDDLLRVVGDRERRRLLRHLDAQSPCELSELVNALADSDDDKQTVRARLTHDHLPLLGVHGVVVSPRREIRQGEHFDRARTFLREIDEVFEHMDVERDLSHLPGLGGGE